MGARDALHGHDPGPTPQPELFSLFDEEPGGTLSGPQEQVQRHTVDQIVDAVPGLPTLDVPVPLMMEQLVDVLQFFDALIPVAEANLSSRAAAGGTAGGSTEQNVAFPGGGGLQCFSPRTEFICIIFISSW